MDEDRVDGTPGRGTQDTLGQDRLGEEVWRRLRALEEHRNALQLAFVALARELPEPARARLTNVLPALAASARRKEEHRAAELLRVLADAVAVAPDAG